MLTPLAIDALVDSVPVLDADHNPADLVAPGSSSPATHVAVVDPTENVCFLGLLNLKEIKTHRRAGVFTLGDLVARDATLRVGPQTPLMEIVTQLIDRNQDAAAVLNQDGRYMGAVTIDEARRRLELRRQDILAEGERLFRSTFEQAAVGVAQSAPDGQLIEVNPRLCAIVGYPREELLTATLEAITHPDDRGIDQEHVRRMLAGESDAYAIEKRYRRKDGSLVWVNLAVSLVRDVGSGKAPLYFVSVVEDIDTRKRAESLSAGTVANLELAVKASNIGLWDWDLVTDQICFSREWKSQIGYAEHEVDDGFPAWERHVHPADVTSAKQRIAQSLANPLKSFEAEFRMRHKDGSWRWIYSRGEVLRDATGKPTRMHGFHLDITDSKRLTDNARNSASFLRAAIDALAASTAVVDHAGNIIIVNRQWREFAAQNGGHSPTVREGANYLDICDNASSDCIDARAVAASLRSVLAGGSDPQPREYACHSPTERRWFLAWMHGFSQSGNRFAVITHQDITLVRLAADRLTAEKLRETVAIIAAGVAHEFQNLLCATALQLDSLPLRAPNTNESATAKAIPLIRQAQSLASALLDLYAGPDAARTELLPLHPWLPETVARLTAVLPPGITVSTDVQFDLPEAVAHALGLEQVLRNLLVNASHALGARGEISVRAALATVDDRAMIEIRVSDNGPGIPEHLRPRIFDTGFSTSPKPYRSGLGLAIAAQLLERIGGSISYEPATVTGSTFIIRLRARSGDDR